jgi:hypothetical protein
MVPCAQRLLFFVLVVRPHPPTHPLPRGSLVCLYVSIAFIWFRADYFSAFAEVPEGFADPVVLKAPSGKPPCDARTCDAGMCDPGTLDAPLLAIDHAPECVSGSGSGSGSEDGVPSLRFAEADDSVGCAFVGSSDEHIEAPAEGSPLRRLWHYAKYSSLAMYENVLARRCVCT